MGYIGPPGRRTRTVGTVSAKDRSAGRLRPVWGRSLSPIQPEALDEHFAGMAGAQITRFHALQAVAVPGDALFDQCGQARGVEHLRQEQDEPEVRAHLVVRRRHREYV